MFATIVNVVLVLIGSAIGLFFKNIISEKLMTALTQALGLCVLIIGVSNALKSADLLCLVVCAVVGTAIGHALNIEGGLERAGNCLRRRLVKGEGNGSFTEGFVNASLLFCVGAMAITGSIEAGLNGNYSIIISKGVIDGVSAISFAATLGLGVVFSVIPVLVYQGAITLLAAWVGPYLPAAVIAEMTAAGGLLIIAIAVNMLNLGKTKLKVGNMLPVMFLPIAYVPLSNWLSQIFSGLF